MRNVNIVKIEFVVAVDDICTDGTIASVMDTFITDNNDGLDGAGLVVLDSAATTISEVEWEMSQ